MSREVQIKAYGNTLSTIQGMFIGKKGSKIKQFSSKYPQFSIRLNENIIHITPKGRQERQQLYKGGLSFFNVLKAINDSLLIINKEIQRRRTVSIYRNSNSNSNSNSNCNPYSKKEVTDGWKTISYNKPRKSGLDRLIHSQPLRLKTS